MKKHILFILLSSLLLWACEKDEEIIIEEIAINHEACVSVFPEEVRLSRTNSVETLEITNHADSVIQFSIDSIPQLSLNFEESEIAPGESVQIIISPEPQYISTDEVNTHLKIRLLEDSIRIPVSITSLVITKEQINFSISDANYDKQNDRIICISAEPFNHLYSLNSEGEVLGSVGLNRYPTCLDVSADGNTAIVGHDGMLSVINLNAMTITSEISFSYWINDVVIAPNNYAYAFMDYCDGAYSIDLVTGNVTCNDYAGDIQNRMRAKLHPSGNYIYLANLGSYTDDFVKLDIREGTAEPMYFGHYYGDYEYDGDLWITEDGKRIITKSGHVFNASLNPLLDMVYNESLENKYSLISADDSEAAGKIVTICNSASSYYDKESFIDIYDSGYLNFLYDLALDPFKREISGDETEYLYAVGKFAFFNSTGTEIIVISQGSDGPDLIDDLWGVESIAIE